MGFEAIPLAIMAAAGVYGATQSKASKPKPVAPVAAPVGGEEITSKKRKQYRPAAQLFSNEDLRLGISGRLGA